MHTYYNTSCLITSSFETTGKAAWFLWACRFVKPTLQYIRMLDLHMRKLWYSPWNLTPTCKTATLKRERGISNICMHLSRGQSDSKLSPKSNLLFQLAPYLGIRSWSELFVKSEPFREHATEIREISLWDVLWCNILLSESAVNVLIMILC